MKAFIFLICTTVFSLSTSDSFSQEKIMIDLDQFVTIDQVFRIIKNQTDYRFIYPRKAFKNMPKVQLIKGEIELSELLKKTLTSNDLSFELTDNNSILVKKNTVTSNVEKAQEIIVKGTVNDANGQALPGANVLEKGTTNGSQTDFDGNFSLSITNQNAILIVSYVGFLTQEVPADGKTTLVINLQEDAANLDEVVIIGYGSVKKSDLTGSVSSVSDKDFEKQPITRIDEALKGRAAGVKVTQNSGAPGAGFKIRIRGTNSIGGNNEPLYVLDGLVIGDINGINVNDIKSMEVLKDASATAVYGSRGANGVVLITTKKGRKGPAKIEFDTFVSISNVTQELDIMNGADFAEGVNYAEGVEIYTPSEISALRANGGEDWQDRLFKTGIATNYNLSVSGGNDDVNYFISGNYNNVDGIVINQDYERFGLRLNLNAKLSPKLSLGLNSFLGRQKSGGYRADLGSGLTWDPTTPAFDENGEYNFATLKPGIANGDPNPLIGPENNSREHISNQVIANAFVNYNILDNLTLNISAGAELNQKGENSYSSLLLDNTGNARKYASNIDRFQNTNRLTYIYDKNPNHRLQIDAIHEQQLVTFDWTEATASGFISDQTGYNNLALGTVQNTDSEKTSESLQSFLGRVNYSLFDKFLFTASIRADGSSKFQEDNRWGYFPSAALAWKVSNEKFIEDSEIINNLKLRVSYGIIGSQAVNPLATRSIPFIDSSINYPFAGSGLTIGVAPSDQLANSDLTWETTSQFNSGFDLGLWNSKLTLSLDVYKKNTTDLLIDRLLPVYIGPTIVTQNVGEVENKGFDITLGFKVIETNELTINTSMNLSRNKNEVISLIDGVDVIELGSSYVDGLPINPTSVEVGKPISSFRGYVFEGVYQLGEESEAAIFNKVPGQAKYKDVNGDNLITSDDIVTVGDGNPDFTWGWSWDIAWKNFDLNLLFTGAQGNEIYNLQRMRMMSLSSRTFHATHGDYRNRWTPNNPSNIPSGRDGTQPLSSQFIEDGSYTTLKNISLTYNFNDALKSIGAESLQVYTSVSNLFTITNYTGFDPEGTATGNSDVDLGIDYNTYPLSRTFTFGLRLKF